MNQLDLINKGQLVEQFVAQHLVNYCPEHERFKKNPELFYWVRDKKNSNAEVDFVIVDSNAEIVPVEVKTGAVGTFKSLEIFLSEKKLKKAIVLSLRQSETVIKNDREIILITVEFSGTENSYNDLYTKV